MGETKIQMTKFVWVIYGKWFDEDINKEDEELLGIYETRDAAVQHLVKIARPCFDGYRIDKEKMYGMIQWEVYTQITF